MNFVSYYIYLYSFDPGLHYKKNKSCILRLSSIFLSAISFLKFIFNCCFQFLESLIQTVPNFVICLDPPGLSQCLNDIQPAKYNSTLTVKCYALGNPEPDVKCELWDEKNVVLHSEGKYCYLFQFSTHKFSTDSSFVLSKFT